MEVFTGYEPAFGPLPAELANRIRRSVDTIFPSGDAALDTESSRLFAMVEPTPATAARAASLLTDRSPPSLDFHYLTVLAKSNRCCLQMLFHVSPAPSWPSIGSSRGRRSAPSKIGLLDWP